MADFAVTRTVQRLELDANAVLKEAWRLYKRLFTRSLVMGAVVFGLLNIVNELVRSGQAGVRVGLVSIVVTIAGTALLQGGLVEIVRGLHVAATTKRRPSTRWSGQADASASSSPFRCSWVWASGSESCSS